VGSSFTIGQRGASVFLRSVRNYVVERMRVKHRRRGREEALYSGSLIVEGLNL
jgi:hypothetical protein